MYVTLGRRSRTFSRFCHPFPSASNPALPELIFQPEPWKEEDMEQAAATRTSGTTSKRQPVRSGGCRLLSAMVPQPDRIRASGEPSAEPSIPMALLGGGNASWLPHFSSKCGSWGSAQLESEQPRAQGLSPPSPPRSGDLVCHMAPSTAP